MADKKLDDILKGIGELPKYIEVIYRARIPIAPLGDLKENQVETTPLAVVLYYHPTHLGDSHANTRGQYPFQSPQMPFYFAQFYGPQGSKPYERREE